MILYHGTSFEKGKLILQSGIIKKDVPKIYDDCSMPTTNGYVFLTDNIYRAVKYGTNAYDLSKTRKKDMLSHKINAWCIFKLDICESLLEADVDEYKYIKKVDINQMEVNYERSLREVHSVRVNADLKLSEVCLGYSILPSYDIEKFMFLTKFSYSEARQDNIIKLSESVKEALQAGYTIKRINDGRYADTNFIKWTIIKMNS